MRKECRRCFKSLPLSKYYQHKQMFDGYLNVCKECTKNRVKKHRDNNLDKIKEYDRNRPNKKERIEAVKTRRLWLKKYDPIKHSEQEENKKIWAHNNKDKVNKLKRKWIENNPEKRRAHHIVNNAIRDGRMSKPSICSVCGKGGRIEGHHKDYSKPLDVIWLCAACHRQLHRDLRQA